MVKFSKQLESQLVPEWKSAFCNYWQLKKDLKQIKLSQTRRSLGNPRSSISSLGFNNLTRRRSVAKDVILVHVRRSISSQSSQSSQRDDFYETEWVDPVEDGDVEKTFFTTLDDQLNKVNQFYRKKESLFLQRADEIKLQLEKLITMRKVLKLHQGFAADMSDILTPKRNDMPQQSGSSNEIEDAIMEESVSSDCVEQDGFSKVVEEESAADEESVSAASPIELDIPKTNITMSISGVIQLLWDDVLRQTKNGSLSGRQFKKMDRKKIQYAEKMLRMAFVELYRGLGLLRSFSYLNMVAFTKILKKYDKITGRNASATYMKVVERSYFHSSDKVVKTMDEMEKIFTNFFTGGDHKKAVTFLRPIQQKTSHAVTLFLGVFIGFSIACLLTYSVLLHLHGFSTKDDLQDSGQKVYMDTVFPVFCLLSLMVLHLYMYGWNVYLWREKRINYAFIFEFATNTEMKYREVLLVASALTTLVVGGLLGHLIAYTSFSVSFNTAIIPLLILLVCMATLFCPFNFCYRKSRYFFLASFKRIILSPLYKVVMADFFLADQLTSQVFMFRNVEYVMCDYITGHLKTRKNDACTSNNIKFQAFAYLVSLLPYWWRLMQCLRRWVDEHDNMHVANGGKYLSAMIAAAVALTYHNELTKGWMAMFIICSTLATGYQLYWDFVVDWGLLRMNSKNYLLRDQLILENKFVYFVSMVLNLFLRLAWLQSITRFQPFNMDRRITDFFFASLEVVRRGHWNFYRLENEHLNNVGKFRAVKTVPLPFRAVVDDA